MRGAIERGLRFTQRRLLWLLLATYALGALAPAPGLRIRAVALCTLHTPGGPLTLTLPALMLGMLLVVAGLGARVEELRNVARRPILLITGLAANTLFPILFAALAAAGLTAWHNGEEAQNILVGLAMVGAMPIAGASTAWSQNAGGNLALSLGLVLGSTLLSPLLTPLGLHAVGHLTHGDYSEDLHELARGGSSAFVIAAVVLPSALGLFGRFIFGERRLARVMPALKLLNLIDLLVLNYTNAAVALPQVLRSPDWDFLVLTLSLALSLCIGAFAVGWLIARALHGSRADTIALLFGLGMNNNGTGLVLASTALADHPLVLLPIIFYNLVQQIIAGAVDQVQRSKT